MTTYSQKTKNQPFNRVSLPKCGRTVVRLNKKPIMMYDKRQTPCMAIVVPAMHTNANHVNQNGYRNP